MHIGLCRVYGSDRPVLTSGANLSTWPVAAIGPTSFPGSLIKTLVWSGHVPRQNLAPKGVWGKYQITACTKRRNVETKRPKRNGRNHRNHRNDRNETTETKQPKRNDRNETAETKRPKRNGRNETTETKRPKI